MDMGPFAPETKQAWKELNEHFGRCPKCGTDPFVGWEALSSHTAHMKALYEIAHALAHADIAKLSSNMSDAAEGAKTASEVRHSESGWLQGLSKHLADRRSEASNVYIREEKFECKECGAVWNPEKWDISLKELGFVAYTY
ncbi:hypothetical protein [Halobaculum sp. P14]|uniref:hypothetical protein n=1 Tax=Halobaculum sp. P14 TaxID=3421638 RepID=UPI003EB887E9